MLILRKEFNEMITLFASELNLSPLSIGVIILSGSAFIIMFAIASAKGGYQDLVKTTLENDEAQRQRNQKQ